MTTAEYFRFKEILLEKCTQTALRKNQDYSGGDSNPFASFEAVGEEWAPINFYVLMMNKMQRIKSFIKKGSLNNESVEDSLLDLINYSCLLAGYIESKKVIEETL